METFLPRTARREKTFVSRRVSAVTVAAGFGNSFVRDDERWAIYQPPRQD
jgi:hypothetical protein